MVESIRMIIPQQQQQQSSSYYTIRQRRKYLLTPVLQQRLLLVTVVPVVLLFTITTNVVFIAVVSSWMIRPQEQPPLRQQAQAQPQLLYDSNRLSNYHPWFWSSNVHPTNRHSTQILKESIIGPSDDDDDDDDQTQPPPLLLLPPPTTTTPPPPPVIVVVPPKNVLQQHHLHHTAIKTRNITMAISFYSLFGYSVEYKFRAGPARAVWMTLVPTTNKTTTTGSSRLELIEVPSYMLQRSQEQRAPDLLLSRPDILGYNHIAMDVTEQIQQYNDDWKAQQQQQQQQKESPLLTSTNDTNQTLLLSSSSSSITLDKQPSLITYIQELNRTSVQWFNKTIRMAALPYPQQQLIGPNLYEIAFMYDADGSVIELLYCTPPTQLQQRANITSGWEPWDSTTFQ